MAVTGFKIVFALFGCEVIETVCVRRFTACGLASDLIDPFACDVGRMRIHIGIGIGISIGV
jgi:hypothetical protein